MEFSVNEDLSTYDAAGLDEAIAQGNAALDALLALDNPADADVAEAERIASAVASLSAEKQARVEAAADRVARMAALREARVEASSQPDEADEDEDAEEEETESEEEDEAAEDDAPAEEEEAEAESIEASVPQPKAKASARATLAKKATRPKVPEMKNSGRLTITAAADVPNFATGSDLSDLASVAQATISRMKGFPQPAGIEGASMQNFGVASFRKEFSEDLIVDRGNDMEVLNHASKEARLPGGSLIAAGGWCAPSETLYDFCGGETTEGLVDLPEMQITRGGIRVTPGPDFATLYTDSGFLQTEAQAIAGTTKACYEVDCPDFTDIRLDAVGLCIKVPILTNAAYPELVQRTIALALIAHQHRVSADLIGRMVTKAGSAVAAGNVGSVGSNTLNAVELVSETIRHEYRLSQTETLEVVAPHWLKSAIRADLANRNGVDLLAVNDATINAYFAARNTRVQWVYNWQALANGEEGYPATAQVLVYPAGTFVKGTSDVINLSAVYDAASLAVNTYTGLFMEEGILLATNCFRSKLVTINVAVAGRTGAADNTTSFTLS
jgi:hypothetical protein